MLVALVQALLPIEGPEGMLDEADEQRLGMHTTAGPLRLKYTPASALVIGS